MDVLVLGGTRFVGRAIAERAIARGHGVTLFNRGSDQAAFPAAARINGDRDVQADVARIGGHAWDAVVDVSGYRPAQVRAVLDALGAARPRYVYISTVSVYADPVPHGASESAPLLEVDETIPSTDPRAYGGLKVLCERELAAEYSGPLTILRPTVVIGPHDYTDRFGWWVRQVATGGVIAAPPRTEQPVQLIDARDLAAFAVRCLEESITGTYNAVGPREALTLGGMITALAATLGVEVTLDHAAQAMAQRKPLVIDDPVEDGGFQVSGAAAYHAGLTLTPLDDSARSVLVWERRRGPSPR